jgi:homoserine kinase
MLAVVVPATLSNLGPGFDVLGMAVTRYNQFLVASEGRRGAYLEGTAPADPASHALFATVEAAEARFGDRLTHGLRVHQQERVPRSRGLGSSATARVAGLLAWMNATGRKLALADALAFLTELEGHPDNVVAAMLGGVTWSTGESPFTFRKVAPIAGLQVALCVPARGVQTAEARAVLPAAYDRADVVFNSRRLAFLMHGLMTGDAESLRIGVEDRVHHPWRKGLIGPVDEAIAEANAAGAACAFISGSGSTLAAFVLDGDAAAVAQALAGPLREAGLTCETDVVQPAPVGAWDLFLART